jgi:hypothetical protein
LFRRSAWVLVLIASVLFGVTGVLADESGSVGPTASATKLSNLSQVRDQLPETPMLDADASSGAPRATFSPRSGYRTEAVRLVARKGERILVAWPSRHCEGANANLALDDAQRQVLALKLGFVDGVCSPESDSPVCLFLEDYWDLDKAEISFSHAESPAERYYLIEGIPYACLWIARGELVRVNPDTGEALASGGSTALVWHQAYCQLSGPPDVMRVHSVGARVIYR